jgi:hypothetical protein
MSPAASVEGIMSDVIGQNNATVDLPAVQQAVDAGGTVILHGTLNFFDVTLPGPLGSRVILVTRAVNGTSSRQVDRRARRLHLEVSRLRSFTRSLGRGVSFEPCTSHIRRRTRPASSVLRD